MAKLALGVAVVVALVILIVFATPGVNLPRTTLRAQQFALLVLACLTSFKIVARLPVGSSRLVARDRSEELQLICKDHPDIPVLSCTLIC